MRDLMDKVTIEDVDQRIAEVEAETRLKLRHLRALRRVLEDEDEDRQPSLFLGAGGSGHISPPSESKS